MSEDDCASSDCCGDETATADEAASISATEQREAVRDWYGDIATGDSPGCDTTGPTTCCGDAGEGADQQSLAVGYSADDLEAAPVDANLGLGCGNPTAIAGLADGETVLDLGSGAGFDCFLAAEAVGPEGQVIGVDMTPSMVSTARENAAESDADNVEFRLGEIEYLPVGDGRVDVVMSNCVVNLSPDKKQVFAETFRVLDRCGRLAISDVVRTGELPADAATDLDSISACVGGASTTDELVSMLREVGFVDVTVDPDDDGDAFIDDAADAELASVVSAATIEARKPAADGGDTTRENA